MYIISRQIRVAPTQTMYLAAWMQTEEGFPAKFSFTFNSNQAHEFNTASEAYTFGQLLIEADVEKQYSFSIEPSYKHA